MDINADSIDRGIMYGRKVTIRAAAQYNNSDDLDRILQNYDENERRDLVVVAAEDLAEAEVMVIDPKTGEVIWFNPAQDPKLTPIYAQIARLVCLAESLEARYQEGALTDTDRNRQAGTQAS